MTLIWNWVRSGKRPPTNNPHRGTVTGKEWGPGSMFHKEDKGCGIRLYGSGVAEDKKREVGRKSLNSVQSEKIQQTALVSRIPFLAQPTYSGCPDCSFRKLSILSQSLDEDPTWKCSLTALEGTRLIFIGEGWNWKFFMIASHLLFHHTK